MKNFLLISFLFLLISFIFGVESARYLDVSFQSDASSGNMTLRGTIVYPDGDPPASGYIPAILIGGSGPGNRWLNDTLSLLSTQLVAREAPSLFLPWNYCYVMSRVVAPYYDITTHLADTAGMAVLTWDKRTCLFNRQCNGRSCGCTYVPCLTASSTSSAASSAGCLNIPKILNTDFIDDSVHALSYLLFQQTLLKVDTSNAAVIGHSAGTLDATIVASHFSSAYVKKVLLLAGPATPILSTTSRQFLASLEQNAAWVNGSICDPDDVAGEAKLLASLQAAMPGLEAALASIDMQSARLASGYYDGESPWTQIDVGGVKGSVLFWQQAVMFSSFNSTQYYVQLFLNQSGTSLLALNSAQDLNVALSDFLPLRSIIAQQQRLISPNRTMHIAIPFLTHMFTDSSNQFNNVAPEPLAIMQCFFSNPSLADCSDIISSALMKNPAPLDHSIASSAFPFSFSPSPSSFKLF